MDNAEVKAATSERAASPAGDGFTQGNVITLPIQPGQVQITSDGSKTPAFVDDDAAATVAWNDFEKAMSYIDKNSWLLEWQYVDYLYQSPNYDRDWRTSSGRVARISRFEVAKNRNTMSNQIHRSIFADPHWFLLEPRGKLGGNQNAELITSAWTELILELCDRADLEYQMMLFGECLTLQGTAIAVPGWEERKRVKRTRKRNKQAQKLKMPVGNTKTVHTWESDAWAEDKPVTITESYPYIEYRRLGTTMYSPKWRHPGRPDLSGFPRIDQDYVSFTDLQQMRELSCYRNIPKDEELKKFFLDDPIGAAPQGSEVSQQMNQNSTIVMHAEGENEQTSTDPFRKPLLKVAWWDESHVIEQLEVHGRHIVIRNEEHGLRPKDAAGYTANWFNIDNSGYGFGTGRLNAGDQRMTQGVLNEALKMIAFPMNAPILYDKTATNAPTQNVIAGLGTFWGIDPGRSGDVNKAIGFMKTPPVPPEAWRVYELAHSGSEDIVGANQTTMQGQLGGPGSSFGRTATGAQRLSAKADENVSQPVRMIEWVLQSFIEFIIDMVKEKMPIKEIRDILSDRKGQAILEQIDAENFLNFNCDIKILCGQKLAAKAAISQLIPFLLQIVQQPQLLQWQQQIGKTVNFGAIENLFLRMSELADREDIFIDMTQEQIALMKQMQPGLQQAQSRIAVEKQKGANKQQEIKAKGAQDLQTNIVEQALDKLGPDELALAEGRLERNTDMQTLQQGVAGAGA